MSRSIHDCFGLNEPNEQGPDFDKNLATLSADDQKLYLDYILKKSDDENRAKIANPPSPDAVVARLKDVKWLDITSLNSWMTYASDNYFQPIPFGKYKDRTLSLCIWPIELEPPVAPPASSAQIKPFIETLDPSFYFRGINIGTAAPPKGQLKVFHTLGPLVTTSTQLDADGKEQKVTTPTGFALVVNVSDGSLWIVFNFSPVDEMGSRYNIQDGQPWGVLATGDTPFSMAKVAASIADSGLVKTQPWEIKTSDIVVGGPNLVKIVMVDLDALNKALVVDRQQTVSTAASAAAA